LLFQLPPEVFTSTGSHHQKNENITSSSGTSAKYNKSALTGHALQEKHVINWFDASVIDREPDSLTRWIKEVIHICKEGQQAMSCEEGSYQLSHAHDCFLGTSTTYCAKNQMKK